MRDVNNGWLIRYIHANGASMFFIVVYAHIGRGLYYGSYMEPRELLWCSGVILLLLMMGTAFTGAPVRRVEKFYLLYPKHIVQHYINLTLGSLLRRWLVTLRSQTINSLGFKGTTSRGVKGFVRVSKTSINCSKALIGVVSRLSRALTFQRMGSLVPNDFGIIP